MKTSTSILKIVSPRSGEKRNCSVGIWLSLVLPAVLFPAPPLQACNVPVFRYALEHWRPQPYEVIVFHKGPLDLKDATTIRRLEKHAAGEFTPANITAQLVDLNKPTPQALRSLFEAQVKPILPWTVVRNLDIDSRKTTVWAGKLDARTVSLLLDSPLRRELVKRLRGGATAVWIHLDSGDKEKDDASARLLSAELRRLATELKLPTLTDSPDDKLSDKGPPLRIAFSMVRLKRDNPDEQFLLRMLLTSEADLAKRKEPMAFPVFGRGSCLAALVGRGLNAKNVKNACALLLAPCTCDAQTDMEWFDLLTATDWQLLGSGVRGQGSGVRSTRPTVPPLARGAWPLTPPATQPLQESRPLLPRWVLLAGIGAAALVAVLMGSRAVSSGRKTEGG